MEKSDSEVTISNEDINDQQIILAILLLILKLIVNEILKLCVDFGKSVDRKIN